MSLQGERYPFLARRTDQGPLDLLPLLPIVLTLGHITTSVLATLDTGSMVNVIPYQLGVELGAAWEKQTLVVPLGGNLAANEARAIVLTAAVGKFPPVMLAFAWSKSNDAPVLLGQMNFFMQFDVCFFRSKGVFELKPK